MMGFVFCLPPKSKGWRLVVGCAHGEIVFGSNVLFFVSVVFLLLSVESECFESLPFGFRGRLVELESLVIPASCLLLL